MTPRILRQFSKHAGESIQKGFNLTLFSTRWWAPGMQVGNGHCIRPAPKALAEQFERQFGYSPKYGPDGYEYVASVIDGDAVGMAGFREPVWGAEAARDGSLLWARRPISAGSLYRTIAGPGSVQWITNPSTITLSNEILVIGSALQIAANHSGGVEGETHRVIARVTYSDGSVEDYAIDWTIVEDQIE